MLPGPAFVCWAIHRPEVSESLEHGTELIGEWSSTHPGHSMFRIPTWAVMGAQVVSNVPRALAFVVQWPVDRQRLRGWHGGGSTMHGATPKSRMLSNMPRLRGKASSRPTSHRTSWPRCPSGSRAPQTSQVVASIYIYIHM